MTKKSTSKWAKDLFYAGSVVCLFLFLAMTFDTTLILKKRVQLGTSDLNTKLMPVIALGKSVWENNDCSGCHTLLGEGAYFASELSTVYMRYANDRKDLKDVIKNGLYNNVSWRRIMPPFNFTELELDALIEFLKYSSTINLKTAWPPHKEG